MSTTFFSLPSELRNKIYELLLLHPQSIDPCAYSYKPKLTPALLRANKTVHLEASSLFYAQNYFNFTMRTAEEVASFLEQIGLQNAAQIRHICIDFPTFLYLDLGDVTLEDDSIRMLAKIRSDCANLSTLTTSLCSTNAMELRLDNLDHPKVVGEALELVNVRFRAISSLQEIIVEVLEDGPSDHIRRIMKRCGWTVSAMEYVEEECGSGRSTGNAEDYIERLYDLLVSLSASIV